ncbi:MAG: PQQ-dependent sugar dehydrogenase [Patescibacteria group bacterium]
MKKRVPGLAIVAAIILSFLVIISKNSLPAVLPPAKVLPKEEIETVNESDLKIPPKFSLRIFAASLKGARDLELSPQGTILVSQPQEGKVIALPDANGDHKADKQITVASGLSRPHGLAFYGGKLFIAEETKVSRYRWNEETSSATLEKKLFDLPKGGRHFTRTMAFDSQGQLFVTIGSTCDVCFENHQFLAAVIVSDFEGNNPRLFAKGLRNAVFITTHPQTGELWGTEMGRDFLGDNLPPDEVNIIKEGRDYGWPLCYGNRVHDTDFDEKVYIQIVPQPPCGETEPPVYEVCAHCAPLGLQFVTTDKFPKDWQGDLLVAYHGSWNRSTPIGYKVVKINLENGKAAGVEDFITGFLTGSLVVARPVDLIFDQNGALYVSDDKGGFIFKINYQN